MRRPTGPKVDPAARPSEMARLVTYARLEAGITQTELARLMFTHQTVVAKWETGKLRPTITTLEKLAEVTGNRLEIRLVPGPQSKI